MTDEEIINGLKHCYTEPVACEECPFNEFDNCNDVLMARYVINLINRQQEEIERLEIENQSLRGAANSHKLHYSKIRAEAVKEFAELLKDDWWHNAYYSVDINVRDWIDKLLKEMAGDTE